MSNFETPKVFQANPSLLKKRIYLGAGIGGIVAVAWAVVGRGRTDHGAYFFAFGITALVFSLRFYFMMIRNGPAQLTFSAEGVTLANKASRRTVPWADVRSIRYMVTRGGHFWEIKSRAEAKTLDFYLDGLTHRQREDLREAISSIDLPDIKIIPFYNPFADAA